MRKRKDSIQGPRADFNHATLLKRVARAAGNTSRPAYLRRVLKDAGFTDVPPANLWRMWHYRQTIPTVWYPTILYALMVSGEKFAPKDLLTVVEDE